MELDYESRTLAGQWVYHETLQRVHPKLYRGAKSAIKKIQANDRLDAIAAIARGLAAGERDKEIALLQKVFGAGLYLDPLQPNFYNELIKGINYALSTREIFERMIKRIESGETQISIAGLVGGYIATAISQLIDETDPAARIKTKMVNNSKMQFAQAADEVISDLLDKAVERGMEAAFNSADFKGGADRSYAELIEYLNQNSGSVLIAQLKKIWRLDEVKEEILKAIKKQSLNKRNKTIRTKARKALDVNKWQKGGLTAEAIENYVINSLAGAKSSNYHIQATHTGATEIKADTVVGFDIDMENVEKILAEELTGPVSRERNVAAMRRVTQQLAGLDNSFIVYSNAKNYSLSKNFRGFSSGEAISLQTYENIFENAPGDVTSVVGVIMNLIPGAIGENNKDRVETMLAVDFANLMFDDVETIGAQSSGARAIHVLYLDGVYVPLSYMLHELANAIEAAKTDVRRLVNVTVTSPAHLLVQPPDDTGMVNWVRQKITAKEGITISARFMSNFSATIKNLFF